MIGDDRDERLGIKKSQNALPLRSINCIPVGVAGNMKAGGGLEMMAIQVGYQEISEHSPFKEQINCIPVAVAGNTEIGE